MATPHFSPDELTLRLQQFEKGLDPDITKLAEEIGERHLWNGRHEALEQAARWIESELEAAYGKTQREFPERSLRQQAFEIPSWVFKNIGGNRRVRNIEAEIRGTSEPDKIIIVGAHYDTFPLNEWDSEEEPTPNDKGTPGANDNGTGIAATLAMARWWAKAPRPKRTLRFVFFVNEEPPFFRTPYMGSRQYAAECRAKNEDILVMMTPETIGCYQEKAEPKGEGLPWAYWWASIKSGFPPDARHVAFLCDESSHEMACYAEGLLGRQLPNLSVRTACLSRLKKNPMFSPINSWPLLDEIIGTYELEAFARSKEMPLGIPSQRWSDDASFWQQGYKAFAITDTAYLRYKHYHEPTDKPEQIRKNYPQIALVIEGIRIIIDDLANPPPR